MGRPKKVSEESVVVDDRKGFLRDKFISLLKETHADKVFRSGFFLDRSGKGRLPDKFGDITDADFSDFCSILKELSDSGEIEHLGGETYNNIKIK